MSTPLTPADVRAIVRDELATYDVDAAIARAKPPVESPWQHLTRVMLDIIDRSAQAGADIDWVGSLDVRGYSSLSLVLDGPTAVVVAGVLGLEERPGVHEAYVIWRGKVDGVDVSLQCSRASLPAADAEAVAA